MRNVQLGLTEDKWHIDSYLQITLGRKFPHQRQLIESSICPLVLFMDPSTLELIVNMRKSNRFPLSRNEFIRIRAPDLPESICLESSVRNVVTS